MHTMLTVSHSLGFSSHNLIFNISGFLFENFWKLISMINMWLMQKGFNHKLKFLLNNVTHTMYSIVKYVSSMYCFRIMATLHMYVYVFFPLFFPLFNCFCYRPISKSQIHFDTIIIAVLWVASFCPTSRLHFRLKYLFF